MKIEINILQYKEYSSELSIMSGTVHETPLSSSSSSSAPGGGMTIDIRPMIEDVSQVMTKHITSILTGVIGEYTIYKETHDTIMGLPCVRKLQDRIMELEQMGGGGGGGTATSSVSTNSREDEIAQLQSAIVDLNRYIHALESKVDMKSVASTGAGASDANRPEEESVKLEVHENEQQQEEEEEDGEEDVCVVSSTTHKNVIVTADALVEDEEAEADDAEEVIDADEEEEAEEEEADAEEEVVEADEEEVDEEEAADEAEEAPVEEEDEAAEEEEDARQEEGEVEEEEEADGEEAEDAEEAEVAEEEVDAEEEAEVAAEEEETEEVEEVKIKGKTYFTTDPQNGIIYACVDDDVGDEVGVFKNGVAIFNKGKK
jgi:hypothetical protein